MQEKGTVEQLMEAISMKEEMITILTLGGITLCQVDRTEVERLQGSILHLQRQLKKLLH